VIRSTTTKLARLVDDCEFLQDDSVDRLINSDDTDYQERRIREEYITGTTATVVLVGIESYQRKFIDWEIYPTLDKQHGLIGVLLPYFRPNPATGKFIVPDRLYDNIESGYAVWRTLNELAQSQSAVATLRAWIEESLRKDKSLIQNWREKMTRNR